MKASTDYTVDELKQIIVERSEELGKLHTVTETLNLISNLQYYVELLKIKLALFDR